MGTKIGRIALVVLCSGAGLASAADRAPAGLTSQRLATAKGLRIVDRPPAGMRLDPAGKLGTISLITPEQLKQLPPGSRLVSTTGKDAIVGIDEIGRDTRGGFLDVGFKAR